MLVIFNFLTYIVENLFIVIFVYETFQMNFKVMDQALLLTLLFSLDHIKLVIRCHRNGYGLVFQLFHLLFLVGMEPHTADVQTRWT
jgi:hypothetical protein